MPSSPTILFLNHTAALGGGELSLCDVAAHFGDAAKVVLLEAGPLQAKLEEAGVCVTVVNSASSLRAARRESGLGQALASLPALATLLRRLRPFANRSALLYANSQKAFVLAACLRLLTRRPVIWHLRDMLEAEHFSQLNRFVVTRLANLVNARVIANSDATRQSFINAGGRPAQAVTIHNGLSSAAHDAISNDHAAALRAALGLKPSDFVVGVFSRLAPWKGQGVLIEAIARTPNVHALIVGDALFGEDACKQQLQQRIADLGLNNRVHMLGFRNDVPQLMKACDVIAHTSTAPEPFGRVIVEAMLARRPVIASNAGGAKEIITSTAHGHLVPPGDAAALAQAITQLHEDPQLRHHLAAAGRAHAESTFTVEAMMSKIEQEVNALMHQSFGRAASAKTSAKDGSPMPEAGAAASAATRSAVRADA